MDLNDAERYAVAALFTLALHSTHVESGVDKDGNSLSESDIAWGCPSEELFDEQLLSQVPLKLPPELLDIFWGFDCMAPAGLAPRLYAWLKIPRKAWPGLLRMPDLAGCAGSPEAVEAFVTLVRRYSAFLDPELDFTTGQASRLQQHFSKPMPAAEGEQEEQDTPAQAQQDTTASSAAGDAGKGHKQGSAAARATTESAAGSMPASEAVAAAAASITAAAIAAEAVAGDALQRRSSSAATAAAASAASTAEASVGSEAAARSSSNGGSSAAGSSTAPPAAGSGDVALEASEEAPGAAAAASFEELAEAVDLLPKEADEGTVVPAATFTPAEHYKHTTSHKAVLALYELIGGCVASNTEQDMEPLFAVAAQEAETAAFTAAAAKGNKKALQQFMQQQQQQQQAAGSSTQAEAGSSTGDGQDSRPAAAWFPSGDTPDVGSSSSSKATAAVGDSKAPPTGTAPAGAATKQEQQDAKQQQQQLQGLASIQWYDARGRVAVKRVAHWLRVPWPQVRAFEQMWSAQALSLDAASAQPKYGSSSRAIAYLKVGAAAVGGGALLAVTGGLAAPAIAAGLGAAVTLAHGGAAVAAAVSGFAGSTVGTAAVTGLFGAWGASVGGGSASSLYGEVTEFGFWDLSQSIYLDGKGPEQQQQDGEGQEAAGVNASGDQEASAAGKAAAAEERTAAEKAAPKGDTQQKQQKQQPAADAAVSPAQAQQPQQPQQQSSFLHRLFSSRPDASTGSTTSASSNSSSDKAAAKVSPAACTAAGTSAAAVGPLPATSLPAAGSPAAARAAAAATPPGTPPGSAVSSPSKQPHQEQQLPSHTSPEQQQQGAEAALARKSPGLHLFGWGSKPEDGEDGPAPRVRSKAIKLRDSAFNTDSDEDADEFYEEYLGHQGSGQLGSGAHTPKARPGSTTPKQRQQHGSPGLHASQLPQQKQQGSGSPVLQASQQAHAGQHQQQQQQGAQQQQLGLRQQSQELTAVEVQDNPLASTTAAAAAVPKPGNSDLPGVPTGAQATQPQPQQQQQQQPPAEATADLELATAAAAASAVAMAAAADTAAATSSTASRPAAAAAGGGGVLSGLFSRKAAPVPVYVPLLPTPVNPKHKDETRMALTIAVNGCCIESMEDYVRPWEHLPSGDCDRFALVWESACLKELGGALVSFLAQQALTQVAQKSLQTFLYTGLVGALALPMTLTTAMKVAFGSKWLVALRRAQAAGKMLAIQLAQGCHGGRPVTLIGCSMGARLVFHCLLELSKMGLRGCVENVILLGAPLSCRPDRWCAARSVVGGRLINGYSVNDWTLGLLYRVHSSSSIWLQAAGMYKVEVPGVENINLSRLIAGHQEYLEVMDEILEVINMHDT